MSFRFFTMLQPPRHLVSLLTAAVALAAASCAGSTETRRYDRAAAQRSLRTLETAGLVVGEFSLRPDSVVDGDTLKVKGIETSLRLLSLDTEEKFRSQEDKLLYEKGWAEFKRVKRGDSRKPPKIASPMGEVATNWAKQFFAGVDRVRLERDDPSELRGSFGRYLTYVFAYKDGRWVNYNVEAVRAGMSPYFMKYGYSRRFHDELEAAMQEARDASRGIWDPAAESYGDYDERLSWWRERADFIRQFRQDQKTRQDGDDAPELISLGQWDALARLDDNVGKPIEILGSIGTIRLGDRGPTRVLLSRRRGSNLPVIFFDKDLFLSTGLLQRRGEFIRVRGTVSKYFNKYRNQSELQIIVSQPGQISTAPVPFFRRDAVANDNR